MYQINDIFKIENQPFKVIYSDLDEIYFLSWIDKIKYSNSNIICSLQENQINSIIPYLFGKQFDRMSQVSQYIMSHNSSLDCNNEYHWDSPDFDSLEMLNRFIDALKALNLLAQIRVLN